MTWDRAIKAEAGFRRLTRCQTESRANIVGEIPDWDPMTLDFMDRKEAYSWNADYVFLTMAVCKAALKHAGLEIDNETGPRTACLIGSALNGTDAFRIAMDNYVNRGPLKGQPLPASQFMRQSAGRKSRHSSGVYRADFFAPGRLRFRQLRHRYRRPHDPGRGLRLCPGRRRGHLPDPRDHSGLCQYAGHHQRQPSGPRLSGPHPGIPAFQHRPEGNRSFRRRRSHCAGCRRTCCPPMV